MAQVAHRKEMATLFEKGLSTTSPCIDEDLQQRIRSLLNSRNERHPIRAPLPSPVFGHPSSYYDHDGDLNPAQPSNYWKEDHYDNRFPRRRSLLSRSEIEWSSFDGSNTLFKVGSSMVDRQPSLNSTITDSPAVESVKRSTRKSGGTSRAGSTSSKGYLGNGQMRYSLRTIPPRLTTQDDLHIRPSTMRIPGSYQSETTSIDDVNDPTNQRPQSDRMKENVEVSEPKGIISGPPPSAHSTLRKAQGPEEQDLSPTKLPQRENQQSAVEKILCPGKSQAQVKAPARCSSLRNANSHESSRSPSIFSRENDPTNTVDLQADTDRPSAMTGESLRLSSRKEAAESSNSLPSSLSSRAKSLAEPRPVDELREANELGQQPLTTSLTSWTAGEDRPSELDAPPAHEDLSQVQQPSDHAVTRAIDDLERVLTEALQIADSNQGRIINDSDIPARNSQVHEHLIDCSCSSSALSSQYATDDEQLHSQRPSGRNERHSNLQKGLLNDQYDGKPRSQPRHDPSLDMTRERRTFSNADQPRGQAKNDLTRKNVQSLPQKKNTAPFIANDWAYNSKPFKDIHERQPENENKLSTDRQEGLQDQQRAPLIHGRTSSFHTDHDRKRARTQPRHGAHDLSTSASDEELYLADFKGTNKNYHLVYQGLSDTEPRRTSTFGHDRKLGRGNTLSSIRSKEVMSYPSEPQDRRADKKEIDLSNRHHFSIREPRGFSLSRSHRRSPIARDWSTPRKRFVATVTCMTTALLGLALGIYAGEVPAIQYTIGDEHHYTILGNVFFFIGLAASTILSWPLPVLHGRKPYTMVAVALLLPLQFPQALAVNDLRSPDDKSVRVGLLLPRAVSGLAMGFANINFMTTLLDLFGASLQSRNPHQEVVNQNDVRRHGGGMGAWLGIWTWCSTMSIGVGFLIGAGVISSGPNKISGSSSVAWGFWIVIIASAFVLLLNVIAPETRRSAYRRSMAEVRSGTEVSRRVARGEIKMHLDQTGPKIWYEELLAGYRLTLLMVKQPGFLVLSIYQGWIYGQIVLIIALLGALLSKYYHFHPQYVGLGVSIIPFGALFAVPFQVAGIFSRQRKTKQRTDSMTFEKQVTWSSHLVRRTVFTVLLPIAGLGYTLSSDGTVHYMAPIIFAGAIGFLSTLAIAECNGLIMETFDTSDLQPGMTGRPRKTLPDEIKRKRTNFSCFPRVTAAFAIAQTFAFLIAAGATGWGGVIERHLGAQVATAVVAGILFILTLLLFAVLWRFKTVQIIPSQRFGTNILSGPEDEWKPIIIGNPSGTTRRMSILELGNMSRWTEIRRRNRLGSVA